MSRVGIESAVRSCTCMWPGAGAREAPIAPLAARWGVSGDASRDWARRCVSAGRVELVVSARQEKISGVTGGAADADALMSADVWTGPGVAADDGAEAAAEDAATAAEAGRKHPGRRAPAGIKKAPKEREAAALLPVARICVDVGLAHLDRPFDYLVPASLDADAQPGTRVRVRFAGQLLDGIVLERVDASEHVGKLAYIEKVVSPVRVLSPEVARLAREVADRYAGTLADVIRLAVPPRHARAETRVAAEAVRAADPPSPTAQPSPTARPSPTAQPMPQAAARTTIPAEAQAAAESLIVVDAGAVAAFQIAPDAGAVAASSIAADVRTVGERRSLLPAGSPPIAQTPERIIATNWIGWRRAGRRTPVGWRSCMRSAEVVPPARSGPLAPARTGRRASPKPWSQRSTVDVERSWSSRTPATWIGSMRHSRGS